MTGFPNGKTRSKPSAPVLVTGICAVRRFSALNWSKDQDGECKKFVAVRHLEEDIRKVHTVSSDYIYSRLQICPTWKFPLQVHGDVTQSPTSPRAVSPNSHTTSIHCGKHSWIKSHVRRSMNLQFIKAYLYVDCSRIIIMFSLSLFFLLGSTGPASGPSLATDNGNMVGKYLRHVYVLAMQTASEHVPLN